MTRRSTKTRSKKTWLSFWAIVVFSFQWQLALAQDVAEIEPSLIPELVAATAGSKPLVIHYTSDDGSCRHCVDNNAIVADAAQQLSDNFDFVSVTANPWRQFFDTAEGKKMIAFQADLGFAVAGLPAVMIFANGKPIRIIPGTAPSLADTLEQVFDVVSEQELVVRRDVSVANIPPSQILPYISALSSDQPLLFTLSSTDKKCPHCLRGNAAIADASRYLADDYAFARVDYDPWQSFLDDEPTVEFMAAYDVDVDGLPMSFVFYQGRLMGRFATNTQDLRSFLALALPTIKNAPKSKK